MSKMLVNSSAHNTAPHSFIMARCLILGIILLLCFSSCNKNKIEEPNLDFGYDYFPLDIGNTWVYTADSIIFDPIAFGTKIDTIQFLIRETITDTFRSNSGQLVYRVKYEEQGKDRNWQVKFIYSAQMEPTRAIRTENNLSFIKIVFPLELGRSWNGNAFIDEQKIIKVAGEPISMFKGWENYSFLEQFEKIDVNGQSFDDVFKVEMANSENLVEFRKANEYYAKGIGLVFQELIILDTQCQVCCNKDLVICNGISWEEKAERGFIFRKTLISFQ